MKKLFAVLSVLCLAVFFTASAMANPVNDSAQSNGAGAALDESAVAAGFAADALQDSAQANGNLLGVANNGNQAWGLGNNASSGNAATGAGSQAFATFGGGAVSNAELNQVAVSITGIDVAIGTGNLSPIAWGVAGNVGLNSINLATGEANCQGQVNAIAVHVSTGLSAY